LVIFYGWMITDCRGKLCIGTWTQQSGNWDDQGKTGTTLRQDIKARVWQPAANRNEWCRSVAQCVFDTGWTQV